MKRHVLRSRIEDWAEKWGKIGRANGIQHHGHLRGKSKNEWEAGHFIHPLDKDFRESLAYFH